MEVNCAAIPETLIESELFGHEKGAFTDAVARRKGRFELAHRGTLFLDEIADMSLATQAKILRVIQEMRFERIGGEESITVDVRLIAATNKDLEEETRAGRFREDLYFRLNVIPIHVPPLRERIEDLAELLPYFMERYKRTSAPGPKTVSPEALELLSGYSWPGNIRELKNFIERVNIMAEEQEIASGTVQAYLRTREDRGGDDVFRRFDSMLLNEARDAFEREFLQRKLLESGNSVTRASQVLGVTPSNLHNKLRKYNIELNRHR